MCSIKILTRFHDRNHDDNILVKRLTIDDENCVVWTVDTIKLCRDAQLNEHCELFGEW